MKKQRLAFLFGSGVLYIFLITGIAYYCFIAPKSINLSFHDKLGPLAERSILIFPYTSDMSLPKYVAVKKQNIVYFTNARIEADLTPEGNFVWEKAKPGRYWISVNDAMLDVSIPNTFKSCLTYSFEATPQYHTINFTVKDHKGNPVKNASGTYQLYEKDEWTDAFMEMETKTDDKGKLTWEHVPPGCHTVWIGRGEFQIQVFPNSPDEMFIELTA